MYAYVYIKSPKLIYENVYILHWIIHLNTVNIEDILIRKIMLQL